MKLIYHTNLEPLPAKSMFFQWAAFPLLCLLATICITQVSNALTPDNLVQKPGNYLDDARLTIAVERSKSFSAVRTHTPFQYSLTWPAWVQHKHFGARSLDRRVTSSLAVLLGLGYMLFILLRYRVLDTLGAAMFLLFLSCSEEFAVYTSMGLYSYPLLILLSAVSLHLLLAHFGRSLKWSEIVRLALVFSVCTFLVSRNIISVYAVTAALFLGHRPGLWLVPAEALRRAGQVLGIILVPTIIALGWFTLDTPRELLSPHRGMDDYFFTSHYDRSLVGAAQFILEKSQRIFLDALSLHPYVGGRESGRIYIFAITICFALGVLFSFRNLGRAVVFCLGLGLLGHMILGFASLVPYGNLRYVLSFFPMIAMVAAIGGAALLEWGMKPLFRRFTLSREFALALFLAAGLAVSLTYMTKALVHNTMGSKLVSSGVAFTLNAARTFKTAIVVDRWTQETLVADFPGFPVASSFVLNTHLKTSWARKDPASLDDVSKWRHFLSEHDSIVMITSMPLTPQHYGALYEEAMKIHEITDRKRNRIYNFTTLRLKPMPDG